MFREAQYKKKITEWKFGKKVKAREMQHILRKENQQRKIDPEKRSDYFVRGRIVDPDKVERFKRDHPRASMVFPESGKAPLISKPTNH